MGYDVHVEVTLKAAPSLALMTALDHQFEAASHELGTKTVSIAEHVSMPDEADAVEFVARAGARGRATGLEDHRDHLHLRLTRP